MRPALAALALLVIALLGAATSALRNGVPIDTSLANLAPVEEHAGDGALAAIELADLAQRFASRSLRFALVAPSADASGRTVLAGAEADLLRRLDDVEDIRRSVPSARYDRLSEALSPYRFSLLSPMLARQVDDELDTVAGEAIADLYGPGVEARPLPLEKDPLNSFGGWLDSVLRDMHAGTPDPDRQSAALPVVIVDLVRDEGVDDERLAQRLEAIRSDVLVDWPGMVIHRTGVPFFAQEAAETSRADIDRISIGSLLGLLLLLLPVFRSLWPLLLPAVSIVIGAATGAALVWLLYGSMHVLTLVFGASLIGIVIDYSVHGFAHTLKIGAARTTAMVPGARALDPRLRRALLLSLMTSALGYAALGLSSVDALARVALFSVGGLFGAWLCVIALLPHMIGPRSKLHLTLLDRPVAWSVRLGQILAGPILRWPGITLGGAVVLLLLLMTFVNSDDDPRRLIDLSPELLEDARIIAALGDDVDVSRRLRVTAADLDAAWNALAIVDEALPAGIRATGLADWLPSPAEQLRNRERSGRLLADDGPAARVLDTIGEPNAMTILAELRGVLERDAAAPLGSDDRLVRLLADPALGLPPLLVRGDDGVATIALLTRDADPRALEQAVSHANRQLRERASVTLQDSVADTAAELGRHRRSGLLLLGVALVAIASLLFAVYRRAAVFALVAVPAASILLTLLLLAVLGVPLTLFHTVGLFLVLGLGMDYTIFLAELERSSPRTTLAAILLSGATSLVSFGLLASSAIPVARFFGQTVLIGNSLNLVFTFVLLTFLMRSNRSADDPAVLSLDARESPS